MFNLMISVLVSEVRASYNNGPALSEVGFGGSFSGKIKLPFDKHENDVLFSLTNGLGIGSHYQTGFPDAVYDVNNDSLELIENFGVTVGYVHGWNSMLRSTLVYCCVEIYNHDAQSLEALQSTEYSSANLIWDVNQRWLIGAEYLWGKRKDRDNERRTSSRLQFTSRLIF